MARFSGKHIGTPVLAYVPMDAYVAVRIHSSICEYWVVFGAFGLGKVLSFRESEVLQELGVDTCFFY